MSKASSVWENHSPDTHVSLKLDDCTCLVYPPPVSLASSTHHAHGSENNFLRNGLSQANSLFPLKYYQVALFKRS